MWNAVERFGKIEENSMGAHSFIQRKGPVMNGGEELCLARVALPETMLMWT